MNGLGVIFQEFYGEYFRKTIDVEYQHGITRSTPMGGIINRGSGRRIEKLGEGAKVVKEYLKDTKEIEIDDNLIDELKKYGTPRCDYERAFSSTHLGIDFRDETFGKRDGGFLKLANEPGEKLAYHDELVSDLFKLLEPEFLTN